MPSKQVASVTSGTAVLLQKGSGQAGNQSLVKVNPTQAIYVGDKAAQDFPVAQSTTEDFLVGAGQELWGIAQSTTADIDIWYSAEV